MRTGSVGTPCLNIWVSGASTTPNGVHQYVFTYMIRSSDGRINTGSRTVSAFIAFQQGRDELVQIPFSILHAASRFTNNTRVSGFLSFASQVSQLELVDIPTPTILVPGIDPLVLLSNGGNGTFPVAEQQLRLRGYRTSNQPEPFDPNAANLTASPTLATLSYLRNYDNFAVGANALHSLVLDLKSKTYFDKVVLVGHSKGTLVIRKYLQDRGPASTKGAFLIQGPHSGSIWAVFPGNARFLFGGNYTNLYPTYPSSFTFGVPNLNYSYSPQNSELDALNNEIGSMPPSIPIQLGVTSSILTPYLRHADASFPAPFFFGGDLIVPSFSQRGETINPSDGETRYLPAFYNYIQNAEMIRRPIRANHMSSMSNVETFQGAVDGFLNDLARRR